MADDNYPSGGGNEPGPRTRRRGALPTSTSPAPAPLATDQPAPAPAVESEEAGGLEMTARQKLPPAKVWGLRVSAQHYDTARTMTNVLATRYRLDQRQVGELLVQYLVARRFDLDDYIAQQVGSPVDLDFFARPDEGH